MRKLETTKPDDYYWSEDERENCCSDIGYEQRLRLCDLMHTVDSEDAEKRFRKSSKKTFLAAGMTILLFLFKGREIMKR